VSGQSIEELKKDILQLQGEQERESALQKQLLRERDVAWETYVTLDNKATELEVASQAQDVLVRKAVAASPPGLVTARPGATEVGIALVLGLFVGILCGFIVEYFRPVIRKPETTREDRPAETDSV
jgi:uncharacterized protein involved in exopolysaccharide biosynthesis